MGANPNSKDTRNYTAPMYAAKCGNVEATELLRQHGANFDIIGSLGDTAVTIAAARGPVEVLKVQRAGGLISKWALNVGDVCGTTGPCPCGTQEHGR